MLLRWGIAAVLVMHGVGHVMFPFAAWTEVPMGFADSPWMLPGGLTIGSVAGWLSALIWLIACILYLAAAVGLVRRSSWWPSPVLVASLLSLGVLLLWWNTIPAESRAWIAFVDVAFIVALAGPWKVRVLEAFA